MAEWVSLRGKPSVFIYIYVFMYVYTQSLLVRMEGKGPSLPESMAKSSSAGGSTCLHIYITDG